MSNTIPLLSIIIWLPILSGMALLATAGTVNWMGRLKYTPVLLSIISICTVAFTLYNFDLQNAQMQFSESLPWLPSLGITYGLGVDGFAILLTALTVFMTTLVIIAALSHVETNNYIKYCSVFLIMQGLMCGVFLATDAILFYVFFEAMMIPMFIIIGMWGGSNRIYATMKFILYTFAGSLFLLTALLYLNHVAVSASGTQPFAIATFQNLALPESTQKWLFWAFLLAFAIKIPMWPVHTWLPDAHVEAPTGGSVILAAITLKIGGYGLLRFLLPIAPQGCAYFASVVIALSLIAIVYISLVTIIQQDLKKLIAYSSIAHMAFVTLGFFVSFKVATATESLANALIGIDGAVLQMISHGFISGALFLCVGVLYARLHTRQIADYGGVTSSMPVYASFFMLFALANVGMPGTIGFVGEFLVIIASFKASVWYALVASSSLVLGVAYTLWMYKRVMFGEVISKSVATLQDLTISEKVVFVLLAAAILLFGVWPNPLLNIMRPASQQLAIQVTTIK